MNFIKKIHLSNLAFLILPLLIITVTIYVVGLDVFLTQIHERNQLYLDQLVQWVTSTGQVGVADSAEAWKTDIRQMPLQDGIALLVDQQKGIISGVGQDYQQAEQQELVDTADWVKMGQGQRYIFGSTTYYAYSRPISGTGATLFYFRSKRVSELALLKFRRVLMIGFVSLLLLFFFLQRKMTRKIVSPLADLIGMVQTLTGRKAVVSVRSAEEDDIELIKSYLLQLQDSIHDRDMKLRQHLFSVMDVLIDLLEIKDSYTASHSKEVRKYSIAIAQMMVLPEQEVRDIAFAATLHDIGKIGVSHTILNKPGKLTLQEFSIIKQHPVVADEVLKNIEELEYIRKIIRHHHEKYDGTGYPDKLAGEAIPLAARVVSVADAFDAMTSDRPYRKALSFSDAIAILLEEKGRQFDPQVVSALIKYLYRQDLYEVDQAVASSE